MVPWRWIYRKSVGKNLPQIQYKLLHFFGLANAAEAADAKLQTLSRHFDWKGGWVAPGELFNSSPGSVARALPF
jgi:hypothetical protein